MAHLKKQVAIICAAKTICNNLARSIFIKSGLPKKQGICLVDKCHSGAFLICGTSLTKNTPDNVLL